MLKEHVPPQILQKAFPGLSLEEAREMIFLGQIKSYPADTVVCREGAVEDTFHIITEGEVEITKVINDEEVRVLNHLKPGDFFGEMAIIHEAPRAATVKTTKPTKTLEIQKSAFKHLLEKSTSMSMAMVREVSRRLRDNDEMAIDDLRGKAKELAIAYNQLADIQQARSDFLTNIAHELRTPLMAANGFLQIIQSGNLEGEMLKNSIDTVVRNLKEITSLLNDILFLQEMDLILADFVPTDIGAVIAATVEDLRTKANTSDIGINVSIPAGLPKIPADQKSLERAFAAMLDNAIKFSPEGGKVTIKASYDEHRLRISIQDQGEGIAEKHLPFIFDRFYRTDEINGHLFRGVGLGLSIAKQVVNQHGGKITVDSKPGLGSIFTVTLKQ